ncbi:MULTISPECIES: DUF5343 domain-containing protein [Agrobacterium]|uniref:DUF5343 domain-containing protein n=1 Tax=Agrobacterium tumefaciens TaxID=358 RepID=UPI0021CEBAF7|nr:DUF5343 domain-containing protein [Agrobacterium tumefaciens]UXT21771.1 DUF5343 domain-containing protein [Agrobacterium tumefaciens]
MAESKQGEEKARAEEKTATAKASAPRKIPGNLPYLTASGTLKRALERLIDASRPDKFNADFMENVLKLSGGAARATIPIMKKMGFLSSDAVPTDLYAKFRTEGGRPAAALAGLRNGFPEIFKRSEYAHTVDDNKLRDIILEITGLKASDPVAQAIKSTFNVVKAFIPAGADLSNGGDDPSFQDELAGATANQHGQGEVVRSISRGSKPVGLVYNINIVLPETSDLKVLNAIFRSIKENLL